MAGRIVTGKAYGAIAGKFGIKMSGTARLITNLEQRLRRTKSALFTALQAILLIVEAEAKRLIIGGYYQPAVDTGRLLNSVTSDIIKFNLSEIEGIVGTGVYYAIYVHYGTRNASVSGPALTLVGGLWHMRPRPFLEDAVKNNEKKIKSMFNNAVKKELIIGKGNTGRLWRGI